MICLLRSPPSCLVRVDRYLFLEEGGLQAPGCLHFVGPDEKCLIARKDVKEQGLIAVGEWAKGFSISEMQNLGLHRNALSGGLHLEAEIKPFIRLQGEDEGIRMNMAVVIGLKEGDRRGEKFHRDLRNTDSEWQCLDKKQAVIPTYYDFVKG